MGVVFGDILPLAVGVAVSPVPVIAAILMLLSTRAVSASIGFALGWLFGIVVATSAFVMLAGVIASSEDGPSAAASWITLVVGVLLLVFGVTRWRARADEHDIPAWMRAIDEMTPAKGLGIGFALAAINPKNLLMCIATGVAIGSASLPFGQVAIVVLIFTLIATSTVAVPVVGYLVAADRLRAPLATLKTWLQANNTAVMSVLVLVIGVVLIGKGIGGLT